MKRKHLDFFESSFIVLGVLFFSGAIGKLIALNFLIGLIRWFLTLGSVALIGIRLEYLLFKYQKNLFLILLIALSLISYNWSDFPDYSFTLIRSELFPMTIFGLYLGVSFTIKELVERIGFGLIAGLLLSYITAIAVPSIGRPQTGPFPGAWTGVYGHKNNASSYLVLTSLCLLLPSFNRSRQKWGCFYRHVWLRWLGLSAIAFVFLTTSGTGLILSILVSTVLFLYSKFRWQGKVSVLVLDFAILVFGAGAFFLLNDWQELVVGIGKDPTLTGRTPMWGVAIRKIMEQPLIGYGRGGFWAPGSSYPLEVGQAVAQNFIPPHIHNGFIDLAIDLGLIGIAIFFISLIITIIRALKQAYDYTEPEDLFPIGFLILFLVNNMTESYILYLSNLLWPLFIAISLNAGRSKQRSLT